jgi:hypothetical protein
MKENATKNDKDKENKRKERSKQDELIISHCIIKKKINKNPCTSRPKQNYQYFISIVSYSVIILSVY